MESISRTVNGRECTVILTDSLVETLADLQGEGYRPEQFDSIACQPAE